MRQGLAAKGVPQLQQMTFGLHPKFPVTQTPVLRAIRKQEIPQKRPLPLALSEGLM